MYIHKNYTRSHKQHKLDQGVVYHVQKAASQRDRIFLSQQARHAYAHENKADLRDRGTCQRPFQVNGEQCQQRADHHGENA